MADSLFKIRGLGFSYGTYGVFQGLDLDLPGGGFVAVVGPNGSGKSTLLDLLLGNLEPDAGSIDFSGRELKGIPRRELARQMALVPPDFASEFPFSVEEVVMMGRHPHIPRFAAPTDRDFNAVEGAIEALDLDGLRNKTVKGLSSGEKQRTALARALAQDTPLLLLDEPTANLDVSHALKALGLLKRLVCNEGRSVIAVLHDLNLAAGYCGHVVCLKQGRVYASGATETVLTSQLIGEVFGVQAKVSLDEYAGGRTVTFKRPEAGV